ncbi:MAG: hypothetical protein MUP98_19690 [Candidatus Aminicenantes bacterium]|nr:hypothetical protein [Candidatus Aminicenantes bacterium]
MNQEDVIMAFIFVPIMFVFGGWLFWSILEWLKTWQKSQLQKKILEKFTTVQDFNDFIQSEEGHKFLNFLSLNGSIPKKKILSSLSQGIIISFVGISLILIGQIFPEEMKYFLAAGIVMIALGVGFMISTFISFTLSKKWGIIEKDKLD